jgi:hypothetical protein
LRSRAAYLALDKKAEAEAATATATAGGGGKFSGVFTLSCGGIEAFYKGLAGRLGTPTCKTTFLSWAYQQHFL